MDAFTPLELRNPFPGAASWYIPLTASTMADARLLSRDSACGLVVAGAQTAGRGRLPGRAWTAAPGESLLLTAWFPEGMVSRSPLPLVAGVAALLACEDWAGSHGLAFRAPLAVKWPNDLLAGRRKLAGVLCEAAGGRVFLGLGLNRAQAGFEEGYRTEPSSLFMETGIRPAGTDPLEAFLARLAALLDGSLDWHGLLNRRLAGRGHPVEFLPGLGDGGAVRGVLDGVDREGFLLIRSAGTASRHNSGELRLESIDADPGA